MKMKKAKNKMISEIINTFSDTLIKMTRELYEAEKKAESTKYWENFYRQKLTELEAERDKCWNVAGGDKVNDPF